MGWAALLRGRNGAGAGLRQGKQASFDHPELLSCRDGVAEVAPGGRIGPIVA